MARKKSKAKWFYIVGGLAIIVIVFVVSGSSKDEAETHVAGKYDTFAQCLYDSGMRMYGSVTCSFCARQRELFGESFHHVQEIECDPRNEGSETELCVAKQISHTPTWIFEDSVGNDVHRFDSGVVALEDLSEVSGCELVEDF